MMLSMTDDRHCMIMSWKYNEMISGKHRVALIN